MSDSHNLRLLLSRPLLIYLAAWFPIHFANRCAALDEPSVRIDPTMLERFRRLDGVMNDSSWSNQQDFIGEAIDHLWEDNGWNDEADGFARNMAQELTAIPPWKPMQRLKLFNQRLTQRYGLSTEQSLRFQGAVLGEASGFLSRHSEIIMQQLKSGLQTQLDGGGFSADQIKKWSQEGKPVLSDLHKSIDRMRDKIEPLLDARAKKLFESDLRSMERRRKYLDVMVDRWSKGKWKPEDLGIKGDMVSAPTTRPSPLAPRDDATPQGSQEASVKQHSKCVPRDPESWNRCITDFAERLSLDQGQITAAQSIHDELYLRVTEYLDSHTSTHDPITTKDNQDNKALQPVLDIYAELQSRLNAIPTSGQRDRAK